MPVWASFITIKSITMKCILLAFAIMTCCNIQAQKKLVPVTQSTLTGVTLPAGSKQDNRLLMVVATRVLLEMESKKNGAQMNTIEVLSLPTVAACGFNADSLVAQLTTLGWNITPVESDNKYVWLQKDDRYVMAYFSMDKKETALYFGLAATAPVFTEGNNANGNQQALAIITIPHHSFLPYAIPGINIH